MLRVKGSYLKIWHTLKPLITLPTYRKKKDSQPQNIPIVQDKVVSSVVKGWLSIVLHAMNALMVQYLVSVVQVLGVIA